MAQGVLAGHDHKRFSNSRDDCSNARWVTVVEQNSSTVFMFLSNLCILAGFG